MTNLNDTITEDQLAKLDELFGVTPEKIEAHELAMKKREANQVVMEVKTKYVITDTQSLVSPIGYSPDKPFYEQTAIAIHIDSLDGFKAPSGTTLYAHNVEDICARNSSI